MISDFFVPMKDDRKRMMILSNYKMVSRLLRDGFLKLSSSKEDLDNNLITKKQHMMNIEEMDRMQRLIKYMKKLTCTRNAGFVRSTSM